MRKTNLTIAVLAALASGTGLGGNCLERDFANPPDGARSRTWWHWQDGLLNAERMKKELRGLKAAGFGGVQQFVAGWTRIPTNGEHLVTFMSKEWMPYVETALKTASECGFRYGLQNGAGWTGPGGPWMTTDKSMKQVFCAERRVKGGETAEVPALKDCPIEREPYWNYLKNPWYGDICAYAFPTPPAYLEPELPQPKLTASHPAPQLTNLLMRAKYRIYESHNYPIAFRWERGRTPGEGEPWVTFRWEKPVTVRTISLKTNTNQAEGAGDAPEVWASDDGKEFRKVAKLETGTCLAEDWFTSIEHPIPATTARVFKLVWRDAPNVFLREAHFSGRPSLAALKSQTGLGTWNRAEHRRLPEDPAATLRAEDMIDISKNIGADGKLRFSPPADGRVWTVLRIGATSTRRCNQPCNPDMTGPACDLMDAEAIRFHLSQYAERILETEKRCGAKTVTDLLLDSWEQGTQNWSARLPDEFRKRRGYDMMRHMPAYAGYLVGGRDATERFLFDARRTVDEVVGETFFGTVRDWCSERGLKHYVEGFACGVGTFCGDAMNAYLRCDVPMTEGGPTLREAPSAAHLTGRTMVAVEAHTSAADWSRTPRDFKVREDSFFRLGITEIIYHGGGHNPKDEWRFPGVTFSGYGAEIAPGQTWWRYTKHWQDYLARCQTMLRRGAFVADVLAFTGEDYGGPLVGVYEPGCDGNMHSRDRLRGLPAGYDYDLVNAAFLQELEVDGDGCVGAFKYPNATKYRVIALRRQDTAMTVETARKIRELVRAGAVVAGPRPERSLGLKNAAANDAEVAAIGREVWNGGRYGKGMAFDGDAAEALAKLGVAQDFAAKNAKLRDEVSYLHRKDGDADIYFVCRWRPVANGAEMGFRVKGKIPEIFDPLTGEISEAKNWRVEGEHTYMPVFGGRAEQATRFVVFRKAGDPSGKYEAKSAEDAGREVTLVGDWTVAFKDELGVDATVTTNKLYDWKDHADPAIASYSGTAVYRAKAKLPSGEKLTLNLGNVEELAEVLVDGKNCGVAWCEPYEVRLPEAACGKEVELEIRVVNSWHNRLLADQQRPEGERKTWTPRPPKADAKPVSGGLIGPLRIYRAE